MKPLPTITTEKYIGVNKLMNWCIKQLKDTNDSIHWKKRIDFLAELRRGQFYNETQKEQYNSIRVEYLYFLSIQRDNKSSVSMTNKL